MRLLNFSLFTNPIKAFRTRTYLDIFTKETRSTSKFFTASQNVRYKGSFYTVDTKAKGRVKNYRKVS